MNILISVLIPLYNVEQYVEKCLETLFLSKHAKDCEFIITNDCSHDNSLKIVKKVFSLHPEIKHFNILNHDINKGLAAARKTSFENATGKYILCVDSDDYVEPNYIDSFYEIAKNNNYDLILCNFIEETNFEKNRINIKLPKDNIQLLQNLLSMRFNNYLWFKLFKREIFIKNNINWEETFDFSEDFYITAKFLPHVKSIYHINDYIYHYIKRENSYTHQMYSLKNVNSYFEIINKIENYLKDVYSDHYYKLFYNYLLINKMYFFYYYVIYGPLKIQRKYYKSFPEIYIFINNKNYSRLTVLIIKFLSKKYFFIEKILLRLNSIYLIIRKNIPFKFYFQK